MLEIQGVTKAFATTVAVDDLSFRVPEGQIFGFLGPNGAGKTTTMRMVLDIIRPDSGSITWRGAPIDAAARRRFGYLPEERGLYQKMRVAEQLLFFARLYGMGRGEAERAIDHWLHVFGIAERRSSRLEELSRGNQQKVQVLAAILHEPDLSLLDEPFSGLDPINVELLADTLLGLKAKGKTIIFSSHQMAQVEELCEEVALIARGRLVLSGNLTEIRDQAVRRVVQVRTASGRLSLEGLPLRPLPPAREYLRFALEEGADAQQALRGIAAREAVEYFALERPELQEIFIEVTGGAADLDTPAPVVPETVVGPQTPAGGESPA